MLLIEMPATVDPDTHERYMRVMGFLSLPDGIIIGPDKDFTSWESGQAWAQEAIEAHLNRQPIPNVWDSPLADPAVLYSTTAKEA